MYYIIFIINPNFVINVSSAILQCFLHSKSEDDQIIHSVYFLDGSPTGNFQSSEIQRFLTQFELSTTKLARFGLNPFRIYAKKVILIEIDRMVAAQAKSVYEEPLLGEILKSAEPLAEFTRLIKADEVISLGDIRKSLILFFDEWHKYV